MNLFLGPVPDSPIGARLFEVAFPPRTRRATDVPGVIEVRYPMTHMEMRAFRAAWAAQPIVLQRAGGPLFDWKTDPDLA